MADKTEGIERMLECLVDNFECDVCPVEGCNTENFCKDKLKEYLFGEEEKEPKTFSDLINQVIDDLNVQVFGFKDPEQPKEHEEPIQPKVTFRTNLDGSTELSGSPEAVAEFMRKVGGSIGL